MDKPTRKQIREFWEWCGFNFRDAYPETKWELYCITYPDGHQTLPTKISDELVLDLNNLFKYAVPQVYLKLCRDGQAFKMRKLYDALAREVEHGSSPTNLALALFWAIRDAIHKEA